MHVVMLSDHETAGGAAIAASRLAEALARNQRVTRLVFFPDGKAHPWRTIAFCREAPWKTLLRRGMRKLFRPKTPLPNSPGFAAEQLRKSLRSLRPDVISLHNLHGAMPWGWGPELAAVCAEFAPVAWTLHDMWSFTGRCAYAFDCEKYITGCDETCPTAEEAPALPREQIATAWQTRRRIVAPTLRVGPLPTPTLRVGSTMAVTPSRWLAGLARRGFWSAARIESIPNGVALDVFRPMEQALARRTLGLPEQGILVLTVAHDLRERRKGAHLWPHIWRPVENIAGAMLVTMGEGSLEAPWPVHSLGWIGDDERKVLAYNAADVLLHPAPVDNLPNVLVEALACGTPAVAMPVGGIPEIVDHGATGWLAASATPEDLGNALVQAIGEIRAGKNLGNACRMRAERDFCLKKQARAYESLFKRMLESPWPDAMMEQLRKQQEPTPCPRSAVHSLPVTFSP
ncbi:MAG: glycosyltransferase [Gemmataceae bacterium]|nr:glycosyltransferase [Gemmataceae bacterium]